MGVFPSRRWRSGCPSLLDGLVLGWPLDESSGTRRALQGNPAGVLTDVNTVGTANAPAGVGGLCANFDGSTEYFTCADPFPPPPALTVAAWVYPTSVGATVKGIVQQGRGASADLSFGLLVSTATPQFVLSPNGTGASSVTATAGAVSANAWAFLVGVWNGATMTLYNGLTPGAGQAFSSTIFDSAVALFVGVTGPTLANYFPGRIAQPLIWRRAIAPDEIAYLYADGTGRPLSDWMPRWWLS